MVPVMCMEVRSTVMMTVLFMVVNVVLHVMDSWMVFCMLMLVMVHMSTNLVNLVWVAMVMPRVWKVHSVVAVHRVDWSIEDDRVVLWIR